MRTDTSLRIATGARKIARVNEIVPGPQPCMKMIHLGPDDWPVPAGVAAPAPILVQGARR